MNNKLLSVLAAVVGIGFVALAVLYWSTPAGSLPSVVPGYQPGSPLIHLKHGIGALLLGLAAFAFAWFQSGGKKSQRM